MRSLRSPLFLAALPLLLAAVFGADSALASTRSPSRRGALVGGWTPIKDINDPHVKEIAQFAVSEHNKVENSGLALSKVMKGETQVVSGTNYRLLIDVQDPTGASAQYVAVVWEKPWEKFRQLTSFKMAN
ncbi:cysteine proteinase inhibitor 1 isoform X2 [Canna indica]|uniref:Cysteine proteinase inhibitor 1 isoform X2 n=1 Tax=Canna indica TaxID=4628 RepID=A0AAQ3JM36_9LILI|nr:cysteine proteinase inhibitor 1 isoform X2 [Canna indica]